MAKKVLAVIPARYGSMRFPGKVLANLGGKPIIQHVWERTFLSRADEVLVAVDDRNVYNVVLGFGGKAVMTSASHPSGSDRIYEAIRDQEDCDCVINVQGDEPFIRPEVINSLIDVITEEDGPDMATVVVPCSRAEMAENPNIVKAVLAADGHALYFSRSMIPFLRQGGTEMPCYRHWGIYAYKRSALEKFVSLPEGNLEKCEKLEQLRALENGMRIKCIITEHASIGIDTPEELEKAEAFLAEEKRRSEKKVENMVPVPENGAEQK
ncbi:MAG: 3-deoxy-manno-octulosonate cytidylyltransferase [Lentisphaeria bacterium]|nr:3-deoxy-manno-octulosonate cytidylyltransferase [Lentisphaeria bacterium]